MSGNEVHITKLSTKVKQRLWLAAILGESQRQVSTGDFKILYGKKKWGQ